MTEQAAGLPDAPRLSSCNNRVPIYSAFHSLWDSSVCTADTFKDHQGAAPRPNEFPPATYHILQSVHCRPLQLINAGASSVSEKISKLIFQR